MAVFGGSYSVIPESEVAKDIWRSSLSITITDYGVRGAGFSVLSSDHHIPSQVDEACREETPTYDIYLFWASTNDFRKCSDKVGQAIDYTDYDGFAEESLITQCGGINYCFNRIREKAPKAKILFMSSTPLFNDEKGFSINYTNLDGMFAFVEQQKICCQRQGIPFLNQFSNCLLTLDNWQTYFQPDALHLNEAGYRLLAERQKSFIENEIKRQF